MSKAKGTVAGDCILLDIGTCENQIPKKKLKH